MDYQTALFCEFDRYAAESYCAVHGVDSTLNIGDITKADEKVVPDFNVCLLYTSDAADEL